MHRAEAFKHRYHERFHFSYSCFGAMDYALNGLAPFDAIVFDYGVSSYQLDEAARGFSFRHDGPLDMRMSGEGQTAADVVNTFSAQDLAQIIYTYGGERQSRAIAAAIVSARQEKTLIRTLELAEVVRRIVKRKDGLDPATLTFQALRIFINNELMEIDTALRKSLALLKPGGVAVCVSFHELEDRIVKHCFKESTLVDGCKTYCWSPLNRKVLAPTHAEVNANPRARSARLRAALKVEVGKRV
jgi:16S rRNA (cytosine1402-N4)-methyltransferase